jgi:hypothetical protein
MENRHLPEVRGRPRPGASGVAPRADNATFAVLSLDVSLLIELDAFLV